MSKGSQPDHPSGWLDVHTHFTLPMTAKEANELMENYHKVDFLVTNTQEVQWSVEKALKYAHKSKVQMQMLSYIPPNHEKLRAANDYAHQVVKTHPDKFGHLAALPTDDVTACITEILRVMQYKDPQPDGFSTLTQYNGVSLSDTRLEPAWKLLNEQEAVVHIHPNAYVPGEYGRAAALLNVAFDTAKVVTDMLYKGIFRRYPNIKFILGHCGGALPALSGRLGLLGSEKWIRNDEGLTRQEMETYMSRLYVDTAATAKTGLIPAVTMAGAGHCIYGSDFGVPCSTHETIERNVRDLESHEKDLQLEHGTFGQNGWKLFPAATKRALNGSK